MTRRDHFVLIAGLAALMAIGYVAGLLVTRVFEGFFLHEVDRPAIDFFVEHRTPLWTSAMRAVTFLGSAHAVTALTIAAAVAGYVAARDVRWPWFLVLCGLGAQLLSHLLKLFVGRVRPEFERVIDVGGKSFPSGHATAITGLWLALAVLAHFRWGRRAWPVWVLAGAVIVLVLISRVYLGVHYPSDVVAGLCLSAAWVGVCVRATHLSARPAAE